MSYVPLKKLAACLPVSFLFQCRSCSAYWSLTFLIFSPPLQNFRVFFLTEFVSFFCLSVFYPSLLLFLCYSRQPGRKRDSRGFLLFCFAFLFVCFLFFFPLKVLVAKMTVTWTSISRKQYIVRLHAGLTRIKKSFHIGCPVVRTERVRSRDYQTLGSLLLPRYNYSMIQSVKRQINNCQNDSVLVSVI